MQTVAIIGAGPAGLAVARWLKRDGFDPILFEQGDRLGGQWAADPRYSGVWPSMHTNTCREMTQFSDLPHAPGIPVYPSHRTILSYLERYANQFDLVPRIKLRTRVVGLDQTPNNGWALTYVGEDGIEHAENFCKVVVASGRFNKPMVPKSPASHRSLGHVAPSMHPSTRTQMGIAASECSWLDVPSVRSKLPATWP